MDDNTNGKRRRGKPIVEITRCDEEQSEYELQTMGKRTVE